MSSLSFAQTRICMQDNFHGYPISEYPSYLRRQGPGCSSGEPAGAPIPNFTCIPGVQGLKNGRSCDVLKAEPSQRLNSANRLRTQKHLFILTKIQGAAWAGIGEDKGKIQYEKEQSRKRWSCKRRRERKKLLFSSSVLWDESRDLAPIKSLLQHLTGERP